MSRDLFVVIKSHMNTFTQAEKCVAEFVLTNPEAAIYMTITELARACEIGDTSVFRFCRHIGKSGYQDFKVDLAQTVRSDVPHSSLKGCIAEMSDSMEVMLQKVLNSNVAALSETYEMLNRALVKQAVRWLSKATHISFFGVGDSMAMALEAFHRFLKVIPNAEYTPDTQMQLTRAALMKPDDVMFLFSYSGETAETLAVAKAARESGAHVILMSRFAQSSLTELCDLVFLCGGNHGPLQNGNTSIKPAELFLLEVLYIAYCQSNSAAIAHMRELTDEALRLYRER